MEHSLQAIGEGLGVRGVAEIGEWGSGGVGEFKNVLNDVTQTFVTLTLSLNPTSDTVLGD
ncbi:MAG TPA: hypothetical protein DEG47_04870 [Cyanobacteria bacterium UBA11148]|nr:hypothetical protein [Cyanobacteria bacterium UBA11148]